METQTLPAAIAHPGAKALLHEPAGGDPDKLTLVRAQGSLVWDDQGRQYIDCTAQAWSNNLGANDPRVIEAAGLLWYLLYLRPRLKAKTVGIHRDAAANEVAVAVGADSSVD